MRTTVLAALFGWPIVSLLLFASMRPRRALLASVILGWMFLPVASYKNASGVPEYTRIKAACLGSLLGIAFFDFRRLLSFRPGWMDLPMAVGGLVRLGMGAVSRPAKSADRIEKVRCVPQS